MYMYYTWNMSRVRLTNTCARNTCNCKCCKYRRISFTIAIVDIVNIADIATQYRRNYKPHCKYRSFRKYWKYRRYSKSVSQKLQMPELHEGIQTGRNSIANIADNTDIANQYRKSVQISKLHEVRFPWFCPTLLNHFTSDNSKSPLIRSNFCFLGLDFTPIFRSLIAKVNKNNRRCQITV